jgi:hypothetical protein
VTVTVIQPAEALVVSSARAPIGRFAAKTFHTPILAPVAPGRMPDSLFADAPLALRSEASLPPKVPRGGGGPRRRTCGLRRGGSPV